VGTWTDASHENSAKRRIIKIPVVDLRSSGSSALCGARFAMMDRELCRRWVDGHNICVYGGLISIDFINFYVFRRLLPSFGYLHGPSRGLQTCP